MSKRILAVLMSCLMFSLPVLAQDEKKEDKKYTTALTINSDAFFGLTPIATVGIPIGKNVALTGYAIFWSGIGNSHVFGHWTEFGGGANFTLMDGALNINPQLGILNGTLLSRGNAGGAGGPMFNEGIVPNITLFFEKSGFELELYAGYYMGTRAASGAKTNNAGITEHTYADRDIALASSLPEVSSALNGVGLKPSYFPNRNARNNYTHYWAFPGYQIKEWLSAGLHWEELRAKPSGGDGDYNYTFYKWTGIYTTLKAGSGKLRIAFGDSTMYTKYGPTGTDLRNGISKVQAATPNVSTEAALAGAYGAWLGETRSTPMRGTYYRVTYTYEF